mmetsp:Transcript_3350/g.10203  ORF Transcript_3350/g.10203 Transcript_3350/m.10203 type:complete len:222 (+) Transcript_3350:924-1589(+)
MAVLSASHGKLCKKLTLQGVRPREENVVAKVHTEDASEHVDAVALFREHSAPKRVHALRRFLNQQCKAALREAPIVRSDYPLRHSMYNCRVVQRRQSHVNIRHVIPVQKPRIVLVRQVAQRVLHLARSHRRLTPLPPSQRPALQLPLLQQPLSRIPRQRCSAPACPELSSSPLLSPHLASPFRRHTSPLLSVPSPARLRPAWQAFLRLLHTPLQAVIKIAP